MSATQPDSAASDRGSDGVAPVAASPVKSARAPALARDPRSLSPWSTREKIGRVLWTFVQSTGFRFSFHNWYGWRRLLLRCFGAKVGAAARVRPSARIEVPWNLELGDDCAVGDYAILHSLGRIMIGRKATISQYAHLCAGSHDYTRADFPLLRPPIRIGEGAWVAADAFIGPGVTVGEWAIVGARSTVVRDVAPYAIVVGNPARFVRNRPPVEE